MKTEYFGVWGFVWQEAVRLRILEETVRELQLECELGAVQVGRIPANPVLSSEHSRLVSLDGLYRYGKR